MKNKLIEFMDSLRDYVRESGTNIAHDERESSEFVDIFLGKEDIGCNPDLKIAGYDLPHEEEPVIINPIVQPIDGYCPRCGAKEIETNTPKTLYACGSFDYKQSSNNFVQSDKCMANDYAKESEKRKSNKEFHFDWGKAKAWQLLANDGKRNIAWVWDCGFKLSYDGQFLNVSSRFYPPCKHYNDNWTGTVGISFFNEELATKKFECEDLDTLKKEVETYVDNILEKINKAVHNVFALKESEKRIPDCDGVLPLTDEELKEFADYLREHVFDFDFSMVRVRAVVVSVRDITISVSDERSYGDVSIGGYPKAVDWLHKRFDFKFLLGN